MSNSLLKQSISIHSLVNFAINKYQLIQYLLNKPTAKEQAIYSFLFSRKHIFAIHARNSIHQSILRGLSLPKPHTESMFRNHIFMPNHLPLVKLMLMRYHPIECNRYRLQSIYMPLKWSIGLQHSINSLISSWFHYSSPIPAPIASICVLPKAADF